MKIMSRCYYLDYESHGFLSTANDKYICRLCGQAYSVDDPKIKYTCKSDCGDNYKKCPVYQDRR